MKLELKSQRRQLQEYQAENDQLFNQINEANIKTNQLEEELKETEQTVEELQSIIEERE
jgi:septal ring factor EnvC (AmiA/AmiB activator)